jgi:hypothetical protein
MKKNRAIASQIISGVIKFLVVIMSLIIVIAIIIPSLFSIIKGKDIPPIDDSELQLEFSYVSQEENAFYDLEKIADLINLDNVPKEKKLTFNYLKSDEWEQEVVSQLLDDNEQALQYYTSAATKEKFKLPYVDNSSRISDDLPAIPMRTWREASYLSAVKAISHAQQGQEREALDEAMKSIIIGNTIENSQSPLITYLVGMGIKNSGLDVMQKVISIIPQDSLVLSEYKFKLEKYKALGNDTPFLIEYFALKQSLESLEGSIRSEFGGLPKIVTRNRFYFKKNLTHSYFFEFYKQLTMEAKKNCPEMQKVGSPLVLTEISSLFKMYFTDNAIGKHFIYMPELALNSVLERRCATESKLKETILIIGSRE